MITQRRLDIVAINLIAVSAGAWVGLMLALLGGA